jgi:OmpA-OmpF porin, OOP family
MKTITLTMFLMLGTLFLQSQSILRYNFNNTFTETNGVGPALTVLGNQGIFETDTLNEISGKTKTVYRFEKNSGFQFDNAAAGNFLGGTYTIELYFLFDNLQSWKRVIDWKNRKTDNGAYVYYGQLNFYDHIYSGQAPVVPGEYTYYVVTRDGATNKLLIYTDDGIQIDFTDSSGDGVIDEDHVLNFFYDDLMVPDEASSGAVALLNLYNYVLDSNTIKQNFINISSQVFSVREINKKEIPIQVFPNPANDKVTIDLRKFNNDGLVRVSLFNLTGSEIYTIMIPSGNQADIDLVTSSFPAGIYLFKAESDTRISTQKIVIGR